MIEIPRWKKRFSDFEPLQIRNFSIISHVDHGKTTLSDHIIAEGGILPSALAGNLRALDYLDQEQQRGITIETSLASFQIRDEQQSYHINLIDTPGHVDFAGKVSESLRLVDNGLIIVDVVEGVQSQTITVLRQAIQEQLTLVLFINKLDILISELRYSPQEIRARVEIIIGEIERICLKNGMKPADVPKFGRGTVILGSARDGWAIDIEEVNKGNSIGDIYKDYKEKRKKPGRHLELAKIMKRVIITKFDNPQVGQTHKFPVLLRSNQSNNVFRDLENCEITNDPIAIAGNLFRDYKTQQIGAIVRVFSGKLERGMQLYVGEDIRPYSIQNILFFQGKSSYEEEYVAAGNIAGIIFDKRVNTGDIFTHDTNTDFSMRDISYIQDPVVGISLEPEEISELEHLESTLSDITEITPGLNYSISEDTGELIVSGIGKLQLDILVEDLTNLGYKLEISDPIVLNFTISTIDELVQLDLDYFGNIRVYAGNIQNAKLSSVSPRFVDNNNNTIVTPQDLDSDFCDGLVDSFKQFVKVPPINMSRIRDFVLIVEEVNIDQDKMTYEDGMISGAQCMDHLNKYCDFKEHTPYYNFEIETPARYLGGIINELQKIHAEIKRIESLDEDSKIIGKVKVKNSFNLADSLRQVSEGHAFWSYPQIEYEEQK